MMRIAVIGSGVSGLSAATYLSSYPGMDVTVYEKGHTFGGRANVIDGGEHCQRLFMGDYQSLFDLLRMIPSDTENTSILESLVPVVRLVFVAGGWRPISRMYAIWSRELSVREKFLVIHQRRKSPLLADRREARRKTLKMLRQFDANFALEFVRSSRRSQAVFCLPGPTDVHLTKPWVRFLIERGVDLRCSTEVTNLSRATSGGREWVVSTSFESESYDAVVLTTLPSSSATLLDNSQIKHRLPSDHLHLNYQVSTFRFDVHDGAAIPDCAIMARDGVSVFLQNSAGRCIAFCTSPSGAAADYVYDRARDICEEYGTLTLINHRINGGEDEVIYCARAIDPDLVTADRQLGLYFAGSAFCVSYPLDSGEAACRSARVAIDKLLSDQLGVQAKLGPLGKWWAAVLWRHRRGAACVFEDCRVCAKEGRSDPSGRSAPAGPQVTRESYAQVTDPRSPDAQGCACVVPADAVASHLQGRFPGCVLSFSSEGD